MSTGASCVADGESVRLFFAFWPDAEVRRHLSDAAAQFVTGGAVRLVDAQNYHLTIAFLGAVSSGNLPRVRQIARGQRVPSFGIRFDAFEYWPKPEVVVAAARSVPDALQDFWSTLHRALAEGGFALNPKRLRPHVTLARKVMQAPVLPPLTAFTWTAHSFCLARSDTMESGSAYTVLDTWPLLDAAKNI